VDHDHLFFQCSYSSRIWKGAMCISDMVGPPMSWEAVLAVGVEMEEKRVKKCLQAGAWFNCV
jgi:hypothetical protein